jgi:acyl carrier protein
MDSKIRNELIDYIENNLLRTPYHDFNEKTMLLDKGLIDSFGIIELIGFIEKKYKLILQEKDIRLKNFSSIEAIENLINQVQ